MPDKPISRMIFASLMLLSAHLATAATPGLWDGVAALPPAALQVPQDYQGMGSVVAPSAIEYVPLSPVYFESNRATITHEGQQALDAAVQYLRQHGNIRRILIEGHTDWKGGIAFNDNLSDRRAEIVRNYLTIQGVDPNLIVLNGMGEHEPVDINWSRQGRQRNRHVTIYAIHIN